MAFAQLHWFSSVLGKQEWQLNQLMEQKQIKRIPKNKQAITKAELIEMARELNVTLPPAFFAPTAKAAG